jgi:hypothetical protein
VRTYCRAYQLGELRAFPGWPDAGAAADLADEDIVYVWEDLTVVRSPVSDDQHPIELPVTAAWREFCETRLGFAIPADLRYPRAASPADDPA